MELHRHSYASAVCVRACRRRGGSSGGQEEEEESNRWCVFRLGSSSLDYVVGGSISESQRRCVCGVRVSRCMLMRERSTDIMRSSLMHAKETY